MTKPNTVREELINNIIRDYLGDGIRREKDKVYDFSAEEIADLIIEDRARIAEAMKELLKYCTVAFDKDSFVEHRSWKSDGFLKAILDVKEILKKEGLL